MVARSSWFFRTTELLAMTALLGGAGGIGSGPADAASSPPPPAAAGSWTVYHDDPAGNGVAPPVSAVHTTAAVWNSPALDGQIYGEPLVSAGRVYVATENDTVYALSAATGAVAWSAHLGQPVPAVSLPCGDITPVVGITGTPVIDQARGEIFVVADELVSGKPAHRLVGLATASGRIEMTQDVDPAGADTAALLQRTGLTLDAGQVVFGFGGNYGDCASYQGRVAAVPETGGTPKYFTVDAAPGQSQGAVWMGGAAPVVDSHGDIWVSTGNGSVYSDQQAYDDSDSVLELSPSLQLVQFFAPSTWATNNSQDLDMSIAPALLPGGQVMLAGKSRIVYLLNGAHLGGIGHQQATLGANGRTVGTACSDDIDGGVAVQGMTVYLPCLAGIIAVQATSSPPALHLLWSSGTGGGPPIAAAGLVWTMGQNGTLYGLDPATGRIRQQVTIGAPANHFPTPSVGDGLLLAASAEHVVAFAAPAPGARPAPATASPGQQSSGQAQTAPTHTPRYLAAIVFVVAAALIGLGWLLSRRLRRAR
jgi:outer membrane protein assembly factor BamB